jgi:prepilin-type N-terminal cleavage/methylation domain-containing protein
MNMSRRAKAPRGLTLIEVMIASVIFLVGVTGFIGSVLHARNATAHGRRDLHAMALANDLAEQMAAWRYDDPRLSITTGAPCITDPADKAGALKNPGSSSYSAYIACAHDGSILLTGPSWAGMALPEFLIGKTSTGASLYDRLERRWVVLEENADGTAAATNLGARKRVWIHASYTPGAGAERRSVLAMVKLNAGALQ